MHNRNAEKKVSVAVVILAARNREIDSSSIIAKLVPGRSAPMHVTGWYARRLRDG